MAELLQAFEPDLQSLTLVPSDGGRFEVTVDGTLLYSKLLTGRHPEPGEVMKLMRAHRGRKA
jgi:selenoprotein W-related protein